MLAGRLRRFTPRTIVDPAALRRELASCRSTGTVVVKEELSEGAESVATRIVDGRGKVVAALSVVVAAGSIKLQAAVPSLVANDWACPGASAGGRASPFVRRDLAPGGATGASCRRLTRRESCMWPSRHPSSVENHTRVATACTRNERRFPFPSQLIKDGVAQLKEKISGSVSAPSAG